MTDPDRDAFAQIKPASIALTQAATPGAPLSRSSRPRLAWIALAALVLAAALALFVLPGRVPPPSPPAPAAAPGPAAPAATASPAVPAAAPAAGPFDDAQKAAARRESQDLLENLLDAQKELEKMSVRTWGATDYAAAIKLAKSGDAAYQQQDFARSRTLYAQALAALQALETHAAQVHDDALASGKAALDDGRADAAAKAFQLALAIHPDDADAAKGLKRAATLDQVRALIAQGDSLLSQRKIDEARAAYRQALAIDPDSDAAKKQLRQAEQQASAQRFGAAMSKGYAELDAGRLDEAARSFGEAVAIRPDAQDAKGALEQTRQKITTQRIGALIGEAGQLEAAEGWKDAAQRYDAALALDPNLPAAQQGRQRAAQRAGLDDRLRAAIARPERLADDAVHAEAQTLLREAAAIGAPGPLLKKQVAVLGGMLEQAATPVAVTLISDGATDVTIYTVAALGPFQSRDVQLRPGHYVAVGRRTGYRDARVEFDVAADRPPAPIAVQCTEKIAPGR